MRNLNMHPQEPSVAYTRCDIADYASIKIRALKYVCTFPKRYCTVLFCFSFGVFLESLLSYEKTWDENQAYKYV